MHPFQPETQIPEIIVGSEVGFNPEVLIPVIHFFLLLLRSILCLVFGWIWILNVSLFEYFLTQFGKGRWKFEPREAHDLRMAVFLFVFSQAYTFLLCPILITSTISSLSFI